MTHRERMSRWLENLGQVVGMALSLDDSGVCGFVYKNEVECIIEVPEETPVAYFYAPLLRLSDISAEEKRLLYEELLASNFLCLSTKGATLALDKIKEEIILCLSQSIDTLDDALFTNLLGNFAETALSWKESLGSKQWMAEDLKPAALPTHGIIV